MGIIHVFAVIETQKSFEDKGKYIVKVFVMRYHRFVDGLPTGKSVRINHDVI